MGSGEGSREGLGGFGAQPSLVRFNSVPGLEKVWEALVHSQVRFKQGSPKGEGLGGFGA